MIERTVLLLVHVDVCTKTSTEMVEIISVGMDSDGEPRFTLYKRERTKELQVALY